MQSVDESATDLRHALSVMKSVFEKHGTQFVLDALCQAEKAAVEEGKLALPASSVVSLSVGCSADDGDEDEQAVSSEISKGVDGSHTAATAAIVATATAATAAAGTGASIDGGIASAAGNDAGKSGVRQKTCQDTPFYDFMAHKVAARHYEAIASDAAYETETKVFGAHSRVLGMAFIAVEGRSDTFSYSVVLGKRNGDVISTKVQTVQYSNLPVGKYRDMVHANTLFVMCRALCCPRGREGVKPDVAFVVGVGALHTLHCGIAVALGERLWEYEVPVVGIADDFFEFRGTTRANIEAAFATGGGDIVAVTETVNNDSPICMGFAYVRNVFSGSASSSSMSKSKRKRQATQARALSSMVFISPGYALTPQQALSLAQAFTLASASEKIEASFPPVCNVAWQSLVGRSCAKASHKTSAASYEEDADGFITGTRPK
jgi:deoxyinosine 3'endonuclease (endonuclease V)